MIAQQQTKCLVVLVKSSQAPLVEMAASGKHRVRFKQQRQQHQRVLGAASLAREQRQKLVVYCARPAPPRLPLSLVVLLLLVIVVFCVNLRAKALVQVPNRHTVASIPGDLVLGILVPVHERPSPKQAQTRTCGIVREQYGIQRVEAAFKTIDSINADPNILPNITLGVEIRDSCWHSPIALEQSIEFIRDAMAASEQQPPALGSSAKLLLQQQQQLHQQQQQQMIAKLASGSSQFNGGLTSISEQNVSALCAPLVRQQQQQQQQLQLQAQKKIKNLVGVVGPASSGDTVQVQNLLQLFNMPQVGYSATSRDLSNKNFFKYFLRVVPSDKLQAQVLIDLMLAHNWTYITVVYTEGSYGSSLMNAFRTRAQEAGICFATLESMPPNADDTKFDELIGAIQNYRNARVLVCMCEGRTVSHLFDGFKRQNISNEYLVVGSDGWNDRFDVVERREDIALGGISIRIHSPYVHDFDDYYFQLSPFSNQRNPWFAEFWEQRFQCNLHEPGTQTAPGTNIGGQQQQRATTAANFVRPQSSKLYNRTCTGRESLRQNYKQDAKMAFVQKSIITMALGLDSMQRSLCKRQVGLCAEMLPINGSIFLQHLMNVSFSFLEEEVYFDEQGDPPGKYDILNFQRRTFAGDLSSGMGGVGGAGGAGNGFGEPDSSVVSAGDSYGSLGGGAHPAYDSYSTLRVFRPAEREARLSLRRRRAKNIRRPKRLARGQTGSELAKAPGAAVETQEPQFVTYSPASDFEYVHVGSWKSSDGLSLFGSIQWPRGATAWHNIASGGSAPGAAGAELATSGTTGPVAHNDSSIGHEPAPASTTIVAPKSVCSPPCAKGHAKKIQSDSVKCCWVCVPCRPREYLFNESKCEACEKGWWPNADQTGCEQIPIQYLDWKSLEALAAIAIALFGLCLTLATGAVFLKHNNTPVVKSTTRELSYMILFAMILCYTITFVLVAKPSQQTCFVSRILPGFSFAMLYGALVTKTNRIARILAGSKKKIITKRPAFMSATAQLTIAWLIVLIECLIIVVMLVREPADKMLDFPSDQRVVLVCNTTTLGIMAPLGFDFFLIAMCTWYAFKTRNVPENFNEAKFIGFTMYTTLVIWIAFLVIYFSSDHKITTLCLCISFSALFALFLLFVPRCYIILLKPEKNNRSYFTTTKNVRCHIGYQIQQQQQQQQTGATSSTSPSGKQQQRQQQQQQVGPSECACGLADCLQAQPCEQQQQQQLAANNERTHSASSLATNQFDAADCSSWSTHHQWSRAPSGASLFGCLFYLRRRARRARQSESRRRHAETNSNSFARSRGRTSGRNGRVAPASSLMSESCLPSERPSPHASNSIGGGQFFAAAAPNGSSKHLHGSQATNGTRGPVELAPDKTSWAMRQLFGAAWSVFARRSRRKESDKTATIQQHLRAIRHAENLDRQTHFRRSQVQRLTQRFDSATLLDIQQQQHRNQHQQIVELAADELRLHWGAPGDCDKFNELLAAKGNDAQRLLAALSQLIGPENVWRLASVLARYSKQNQPTNNGELAADELAGAAGQGQQEAARIRFPLDLRRPADRRLALAWLRFLIQMAHKALESLQVARGVAAPAGGGELKSRASLSAQQSCELRPPRALPPCAQLTSVCISRQFSVVNSDEGQQQQWRAPERPEQQQQQQQQQANSLDACTRAMDACAQPNSSGDTSAPKEAPPALSATDEWLATGGRSDDRLAAERRAHTADEHDGTADDDDDDDPIRRALERIMGRQSDHSARLSRAVAPARVGGPTSCAQRRARSPGGPGYFEDDETNLRLGNGGDSGVWAAADEPNAKREAPERKVRVMSSQTRTGQQCGAHCHGESIKSAVRLPDSARIANVDHTARSASQLGPLAAKSFTRPLATCDVGSAAENLVQSDACCQKAGKLAATGSALVSSHRHHEMGALGSACATPWPVQSAEPTRRSRRACRHRPASSSSSINTRDCSRYYCCYCCCCSASIGPAAEVRARASRSSSCGRRHQSSIEPKLPQSEATTPAQ